MRKLSFVIAIITLFSLILLLNLPAKSLNSPSELTKFQNNQKVSITGNIIEERNYKTYNLLILDSGFEVYCDCKESYLNSRVIIIGTKDDFSGKLRINLLKIQRIK